MITDIAYFLSSRGFSPVTQEGYRYLLYNLDKYLIQIALDVRDLTPPGVIDWLNANPQWGENQRYKAYSCLRSYVRWRFGQTHPVMLMRYKRPASQPQRTLTREKLDQLLDSIDLDTPTGLRDYALISLLVDTGLRKAEVCRLDLKHVDIDKRILQVRIKGGTWGVGVFSEETANCLEDWLSIRETIAKPGVETLFVSVGGLTPGNQLTRDGLTCVFRYLGKRAGFHLSPHDLRRTFATLATIDGAPTELVRKAGRWSSDTMVKLYTQAVPVAAITPYLPMTKRQPAEIERGNRN